MTARDGGMAPLMMASLIKLVGVPLLLLVFDVGGVGGVGRTNAVPFLVLVLVGAFFLVRSEWWWKERQVWSDDDDDWCVDRRRSKCCLPEKKQWNDMLFG